MTIPDEAVQAANTAYHGYETQIAVEDMRAALTAALPFLQGVKVKALEWDYERAMTPFGEYLIMEFDQNNFEWQLKISGLYADDTHEGKGFNTKQAAKAAAQADYEARILSAIEPAPSPRAQALEELHATSARLSRLLTVCHGLRWTDVGVLALDNESTKKALGDLSEILFDDGISCALSDGLEKLCFDVETLRALSSPVANKKSDEFVAYRFKHRNDGPHMWEYYPLPVEKSDNPDFVTQALTLKKLLAILNSDQHADRQSQPVADHIADAGKLVAGGRKFNLGDRLTKNKGSSWTGHVVGFYSTELTPIGYAIESETEKGSVQIYPEAALRPLPSSPGASDTRPTGGRNHGK